MSARDPARSRQTQAMSSTAPASVGFGNTEAGHSNAVSSSALPAGSPAARSPQAKKGKARTAPSPVPSSPVPGQAPKCSNTKTEAPPDPTDPTLLAVAAKMTDALLAYYQRRGVHVGIDSNWEKFFEDVDKDGSGRMTFEELDNAVRGMLRAQISRYELRVFWRRLDNDDSGLVTLKEFARLFYRIDMSHWPDMSPAALERVVGTLNKAAEKWHRSGGNWFKIFTALDSDNSGAMAYDELKRCVRGSFPALQIREREISEVDLQGLWKLLDADRSMEVTVHEFMVFMRRNGANHSMHKLTSYSKKKRGLEEIKENITAPDRSQDELRETSKTLERALQAYWRERGVHANTHCSGGSWDRFFQEVDTDGSGRLIFPEFSGAIQSKLSKWTTGSKDTPVSLDDLKALWLYIDPDNSGEVTSNELTLALYRLELDSWPDASDALLGKVIGEMNASAKHWHRAAGNWYKMFCIVDSDGSGHIGFDELRDLIRMTYPGLSITPDKVSDQDIRAFWKALDENRSAEASVQEFMVFMRKKGAQYSMHKLTAYTTKMRNLEAVQRDVAGEIANAPQLTVAQMADVSSKLAKLLHEWLAVRGIGSAGSGSRSDVTSPALWDQLFALVDTDRSGRLGFTEFESACWKILKSRRRIDDEELKALWRAIDSDGSLEATAKEFGQGIYRLQLEAWPVLDEETMTRHITVLNRAADKWHRCSGNWYKVFCACDADGSGEMEFQEMVGVVRDHYPGLSITSKEMNDDDLRGLWRCIDSDRSGKVSIKEFMSFMRLHGRAMSMHKLTDYSMQKRGLKQDKIALPPIERPRDHLRAVVRLLDAALAAYWKKRGVHVDVSGNWPKFFEDGDNDGSGRLTFNELENLIVTRLRRFQCGEDEVIRGVSRDDLIALWHIVDVDKSSEVTAKEWSICLYRIDIEDWPEVDTEHLTRIVDVINAAAEKWHRAGGNWYKVFRLVDTDDSGHMGFDELKAICWRPLPCLAIPPKKLPEVWLKALWKALDADRSGMTSVNEFMIFMRKHGTQQFHNSPREKRPRFVGLNSRAEMRADTAMGGIGNLSADQMMLLSNALSKQTVDTVAAAYNKWGIPWAGLVSEWDMLAVFRKLLGIIEDHISDDEIHTVWSFMDRDGAGQVAVETLLGLGDWLREAMATGDGEAALEDNGR